MATRVDDVELAKQVRLVSTLGGWPVHALESLVRYLYGPGLQYDSSMADVPIELAVHNLRAAQDSCVLLGDGGVVLYFPVQPGLMAQGHIHIWDPQWYGRVEILKKLNRWAMKKWDLLRLTVQPPKRNKLANKLAQDLGFTQEGVLRSAVRYNEGVDDLVVYGLLREEG